MALSFEIKIKILFAVPVSHDMERITLKRWRNKQIRYESQANSVTNVLTTLFPTVLHTMSLIPISLLPTDSLERQFRFSSKAENHNSTLLFVRLRLLKSSVQLHECESWPVIVQFALFLQGLDLQGLTGESQRK